MTGEVLDQHTEEAHGDTDEGCFLVTHLGKHLTCGDSHEQVSKEVHEVTHDTQHV